MLTTVSDVHVLVPFYGDPTLLRKTVRSVIRQSDPRWLLTVVDDDGRDPELGEWLSSFGDARVRYVRNPQRLGANRNFQRCLDLAETDWLVITGCDDVLGDDYVRVVRSTARRHPSCAVIQPRVAIIDENGRGRRTLVDSVKAALARAFRHDTLHGGERLAVSLLHGNWLYFPALCWRRDVVRPIGFRPEHDTAMDLVLLLDVLRGGGTLVLASARCFAYRRHSGSESSWRAVDGSRFREEGQFFRGASAELRAHGWPRAARAASLHVTSRLHALALLPHGMQKGRRTAVSLLRYAVAGA